MALKCLWGFDIPRKNQSPMNGEVCVHFQHFFLVFGFTTPNLSHFFFCIPPHKSKKIRLFPPPSPIFFSPKLVTQGLCPIVAYPTLRNGQSTPNRTLHHTGFASPVFAMIPVSSDEWKRE